MTDMSETPKTSTPIPDLPAGARFDPVTGAELTAGASGERRQSFALQPGEPVASFNVLSALMPLASGSAPQTYRWALGLGILIPVVAGALGFLAFAFVAAALVVPAVYVVYMYDVNQWEDQPVGVVLGAIGAAAALAVGFTFLWHAGLLGNDLSPVDFDGHGSGSVRWTSFFVLVLLVPIVSEVLKEVGPILLARMPQFDDMIDGLTFGVAAGAAFAAAETIVVNRGLFSTFGQVDSPNAGFWVSLILSAAVVKPLVYGAATGIAVASFSGLGAGYDGFRPGYFRGLAEALAANIVFQAGLFFAARVEGTAGAVIGLVWGALVAAVLVVRLRYLLHYAVLEAALEAASSGTTLKDAAVGTAYCPSCEMPLLAGANFCVVCGTSVRAGNKVTRSRNRTEDTDPATVQVSLRPAVAGVAPQDNKKTALVVGVIVATILVGGVIGQVAASAATDQGDEQPPTQTPVILDPSAGEEQLNKTSAIHVGSDATGTDEGRSVDAAGAPGGIVQLSNSDDVMFLMPKGFRVVDQEDGYVQVFGYKGYFFAYLTPKKTTLNKLITNNLTGLQNMGVEELEITQPQAVQVSGVSGAATLNFRGLLATQQGGSIPVEGFAYYFLRTDGTGTTAFALYGKGALKPKSKLLTGYNTMLNTLASTL
jgi:RsiW-degrading membrane proteinase PrsW (M82 family)